MTIVNLRSPAMIGGVSQQGPSRRLPGQVERMDNAWASPVDGLRKRHPLDHVREIVAAPGLRDARLHAISRDGEEYLVVLKPKFVSVYGADGTSYPVVAPTIADIGTFGYLDTRSAAQHLIDPETFAQPRWTWAEDATTPTFPGVAGPLGFGEAARIGHRNEVVGADGIYRHGVNLTAEFRKHLSLFVRVPTDTADPLPGIRLVLHEGLPSNSSVEAVWTWVDGAPVHDGFPSSGVQARTVEYENGWYRLEMTYEPTGASPVDYAAIELLVQGALGPDHRLDAWGAQLADTDLRTFADFPPYLKGNVHDDLRATTVQDTTWLVNSSVSVFKGAAQSAGQVIPETEKVIWIRQGSPHGISFTQGDGSLPAYDTWVVQITTSFGATFALGLWTIDEGGGFIEPYDFPVNYSWETTGPGTDEVAAKIKEWLPVFMPQIEVEANGSIVKLRNLAGGETITEIVLTDSFGDVGMQIVGDEVESFEDLPTTFYHGQKVKIIGTGVGTEDDYWVEFRAEEDAAFGTGRWYETTAPGIDVEIDAATMPHVLLRKFDDGNGSVTGIPSQVYFEFGPFEWAQRATGDDDSNPFPSFVSTYSDDGSILDERQIRDVFYHRERLGFLSDTNAVLSEVGVPGNFFRTTVLSLLDGDLIDVTASDRKVNKLFHAVPFEGRLLAFSENSIFALGGSPILAPRTVEFPSVLSEETLTSAAPATSGASLLFCSPHRSHTLLREGFVPETSESVGFRLRRNDLSEQAPTYVPGAVLDMASTNASDEVVVAMRADGDLSTLFVYKSHVTGGRRVQSAWWRYPLGNARIEGLAWIHERLYLLVERSGSLNLECMRVASAALDDDSELQVCLDRRITELEAPGTYDSDEQETTFALPYTLTDETLARVVTRAMPGAEGGEPLVIAGTTPTSITVEGDASGETVWIGEAYSMIVDPGRVVVRGQSQDGSIAPRIVGGEALVGGAMSLRGPIDLDVRVADRYGAGALEQIRDEFGPGAPFDQILRFSRNREFGVLADPEEAVVTLEAHSHLATHVDALEWQINKKG